MCYPGSGVVLDCFLIFAVFLNLSMFYNPRAWLLCSNCVSAVMWLPLVWVFSSGCLGLVVDCGIYWSYSFVLFSHQISPYIGGCLLISCLPGKASRTLIDRLAERFNMSSQN